MSKVIRLSDELIEELDIFRSRYLKKLQEDSKKYDSQFLNDLLDEKSKYSDIQWLHFAVRFACNHSDD